MGLAHARPNNMGATLQMVLYLLTYGVCIFICGLCTYNIIGKLHIIRTESEIIFQVYLVECLYISNFEWSF